MQTETPRTIQRLTERAKLKAFYWIAAAAQTIAAVLDLRDGDQLKTASQFSLALTLVLLATTGQEQSRFRNLVIYVALAVALGLLLARILERSEKLIGT
jgi:hypothetical protein